MALPDLSAVRLEYQEHRQHEFIQFLRSTRDPRVLSVYLENVLLFPERSAPPDYQHGMEHMTQSVKEMVLAVDRMITMQQRTHALAKLQRLIDEIHALAAS
jgi:murein tripeptide amidase MpaA